MKKIVQKLKQALLVLLLALIPFTIWGAQGSVVIPDGTGAQVLTNINTANQVLITNNSGASEPSTTYAYQLWADTTAGVMKQRNAANSAWITLYTLATPDTGRTFTTTTLSGTTTAGTINAGALSGTTGAFSSTVSSTKACASGYTRVSPNYCKKNESITLIYNTLVCTQTAALTGVTDATAVDVNIYFSIGSQNAAGLRGSELTSFDPTDTSCAGSYLNDWQFITREFSAVSPAGTIFAKLQTQGVVRSSLTGRIVLLGGQMNANSITSVYINGYYD